MIIVMIIIIIVIVVAVIRPGPSSLGILRCRCICSCVNKMPSVFSTSDTQPDLSPRSSAVHIDDGEKLAGARQGPASPSAARPNKCCNTLRITAILGFAAVFTPNVSETFLACIPQLVSLTCGNHIDEI